MFSTSCLAVLALATAAASLSTQDISISTSYEDKKSLFQFPFFNLGPLFKTLPRFENFSPKIHTNEDMFQMVIQVQDYKKSDLTVSVEGGLVIVKGSYRAKNTARQFTYSSKLPANISASSVTAELTSDGFLIISAPVHNKPIGRSQEATREVPIVSTATSYKE